ncbi:Lsr2 family protein [Myceligenerans pegani]|uniref:Lsr2 family protein n=1 Tax=Myceligenerans pegani TaxID=2776917 RepID=A0ABR9MU93_9MICO|nr:Lsr2 family protein [Myceligenerans sp. TRM 65318]MBE1874935.1 Lsr2 family protein [Myceligenerans sp. TRM 65318]MBE3017206.1 Lsr2 family protein [Myceligenerans sp. TRM 65318]
MTLARSDTGTPAYAVLGVTTSGIDLERDTVRDLSVVRLDERGGLVDEWDTTLDEGTFADQGAQVRDLLSQMAVVTHNGRLGVEMLRRVLTRAGWDVPAIAQATTLEASFTYLPRLGRRRLADCCTAAGVPGPDGEAPGEARATAGLLVRFLDGAAGITPAHELTGVTLRAWVYPWPTRPARAATPRPRPWVRPSPRPYTLAAPPSHLNARQLADGAADTAGHEHAYLIMLAEELARGRLPEPEHAGRNARPDLTAATETPALRLLTEVAALLRVEDLGEVHRGFVNTLIAQAIEEDRYAQEQRQELFHLASQLGVPWSVVLEPIVEATPIDFPKVVDNTGSSRRPAAATGAGPKAIRAWAAANGYVIEPEEKIPWNVVRAFEEAQEEQN